MVLRIFKKIATSGFLTALECTKFVFGRGFTPDLTGELGKERGKGEGKGREKEGEGTGRTGSPYSNS